MSKRVWIINMMIMAFLLCHVLTAQATSYRAVCVGISDYPGSDNDLPADCVNDATDMRDYLVTYQGWSSGNIELRLNSQATEGYIASYIGAMPNSTGNSELFFYSGHGNGSGLYTYSGTLVPSELQSAFGSSFNQYCCFLDACYSGIFVNQMSKGEISSACEDDELSYTGGPDNNSVYSYYVLEGIKDDQADPESGHVVSAKEVHDYAAPRTTQYLSSMHPQFRGNLGVLNFAALGPTTSGTLIDSELWDQNVTLSGNVIVPSDKILAIYDRTVSLNGYYIKCIGSGKIVRSGNATFNPTDISIKSGSDYKGQYPSIYSAISNVVSDQTIVVGGGSHTVSNNLTVASCVTLQINAGTTLNFTGNYKLRVEGTLVANGTYSDKITFTRSGGTWYGIEFYNASYLSQISYSIIQNAQYGARIINSSPNLTWNSIKLNTVGVQFENNSWDYGTTLQGNMIEENVDGVKCYQYSDPALNPSNVIRYNIFYGVYGDATAVPSLGVSYPTGYNSVYYNGTEVWSAYYGTIYARLHWWGDADPTPNVSGNVDWSNYLDFDPNSGLGKPLVENHPPQHSENQLAGASEADTLGMAEVDLAYKIFLGGEYDEALSRFETIVGKYPDHFSSRRALVFVTRCLDRLNRRNESLSRAAQLVQNFTGKEVFGLAQSLAVGELVKSGQYAEAVAQSQEIVNNFPGTTLAKYALYDLGSIHWYRLEDEKTGEIYFRQLISAWPEDDLTISALATLGEWKPAQGKSSQPASAPLESVPTTCALAQNFPNPFNPSTSIAYQMPAPRHVKLTVFNTLGQVVMRLVNRRQDAGFHTVMWHGRNFAGEAVPSGIYYYRLEIEGRFVEAKKMVLAK